MRAVESLGYRLDDVPQAALVEAAPFLQQLGQRNAVLKVHHHVSGAMNLEEAANADDVGMACRGRQVPQKLRLLDELLQAQRMHFLDIGADRDDRALGIAFGDRAWEIFLDGNELAEIDSAALVDDAESAHAKDVFQTPFAQDRAGR